MRADFSKIKRADDLLRETSIHRIIEHVTPTNRRCHVTGVDLIDLHNAIANLLKQERTKGRGIPVEDLDYWCLFTKSHQNPGGIVIGNKGTVCILQEPTDVDL